MRRPNTFIAAVKTIILFFGGLYLLGFGLFHGSNAKGTVDAILPYEWAACTLVGFLFLGWSVLSYSQLWGKMRR